MLRLHLPFRAASIHDAKYERAPALNVSGGLSCYGRILALADHRFGQASGPARNTKLGQGAERNDQPVGGCAVEDGMPYNPPMPLTRRSFVARMLASPAAVAYAAAAANAPSLKIS